jgi:hypothetical protein
VNDDESNYTYYSDKSLEKRRNKKLSLLTYVPIEREEQTDKKESSMGSRHNSGAYLNNAREVISSQDLLAKSTQNASGILSEF